MTRTMPSEHHGLRAGIVSHRLQSALIAGAVLGATLFVLPGRAAAGMPSRVDLASAGPFAVLAAGGIGATGSSRVTGDVGTYPRPSIPDRLEDQVHGRIHRGGAAAMAAQTDLADAYAVAARAIPTRPAPDAAADGAALLPGTYALAGDPVGLRGRVILDGGGDRDATWIFQVSADLESSSDSTIELVDGAQACNVFWQVGGSVTLGAGSRFAGTVLATTVVTAERGATVLGRLLSMTGRVILGSNTVTLPVCLADASAARADVPAPPRPAPVAGAASSDLRPSAPVDAPSGGGRPSMLPVMAFLTIVMAVLLDDPRRRRRSAAAPG